MALLNSIKSIAGSVGAGVKKGVRALGSGVRGAAGLASALALTPPTYFIYGTK